MNQPSELKWIDLVNPTQSELDKLSADYNLPSYLLLDCLEPDHLPKYERHENLDFLILRIFDEESDNDAKNLRELTRKIAIFYKEQTMITIHRAHLPYLDKVKTKKHKNSGHLLASLIKASLLTYEKPLEKNLELMEQIESSIGEKHDSAVMQHCFYLRRRSTIFKRMIHMSGDIILKMSKEVTLPKNVIQDLKETVDDLYYYADDLQENINHLLNIHLSMLSDELNRASFKTNEVMRVLTVLSVFFMPLNFIAGVYGMNFSKMPFLDSPYGFWAITAIMMFISFIILFGFKKKGWLRPKKNLSR